MRALFLLLALAMFAAAPAAADQKSPGRAVASKSAAAPTTPVNLNTANQAQLEALPGIGPKVALRIIEFRQKNGGFKKVEDLMNVKGIGEKSFLKLKAHITLDGKAVDHPAASGK
jgi:competence protein ComEA